MNYNPEKRSRWMRRIWSERKALGWKSRRVYAPLSEETKARIGIANSGRERTIEQKEKARCIRVAYLREHPEMHPNRLLAIRNRLTKPHSIFKQKLLDRGFIEGRDFEVEKRVGRYYVDIAFRNKLAVEIDGDHWHQNDNHERDTFLISRGYTVYHIVVKNGYDEDVDILSFFRPLIAV